MLTRCILLTALQVFAAFLATAQQIELSGPAKFILDDQEAFQNPAYDDGQWTSVVLPSSWKANGVVVERRVGWYRIHFNAPNSLLTTPCLLFAGTIDDADETYLNGVKIGSTGTFPPNDQSAWDAQRKYTIPPGLLRASNVLAIRVYNGILDAGLYGGKLYITKAKAYEKQLRERYKNLHSQHYLSTSNGLVAAVYNDETNAVESFYPHIFSYYDSAKAVFPVLRNLRHNLKTKPRQVGYWQQTHIIQADYGKVELYYFCSFTQENKALYICARGEVAVVNSLEFTWEPGQGKVFTRSVNQPAQQGATRYFVFTFTDSLHQTHFLDEAIAGVKTAPLLENERRYMRGLIESCKLPGQLKAAERAAAEQSIAILKMSQVSDKEVLPLARGQVLASLRPGVWAISWVRDAAYAIEAMSKVGMFQEAKKGLEFMLRASPTSQYVHYIHTDGIDYGIGVPYLISVTRYFGNGREESDYAGETGPNIELDDFGLFLIAFCHYVEDSGDVEFYRQWQALIREKVVLPIVHNLTKDDILRTDSGPWEHHLPGKQFLFPNVVCARGMQLFDALGRQYGENDPALTQSVQRMLTGIDRAFLIEGRYYKGNVAETKNSDHHYFDAASFELFACGLSDKKALFQSHLQEYSKHLQAARDPRRGYIRFDSQDSYENQEWPFAGLRVAIAEKRMGDAKHAKQLIDRITRFASKNYHIIPEIIGLEELEYRGSIPMVGYGAGAYLLALTAYYP